MNKGILAIIACAALLCADDVRKTDASAATLPCHEAVKCDSAEPASFFTLGAPLQFTVVAAIANGAYQVLNHRDEIVARGGFSGGRILLEPLPLGYYRLKVEAPGQAIEGTRSFVVVPRVEDRHVPLSCPYSVDTCWGSAYRHRFGKGNPEWYKECCEFYTRICALAGLRFVRGRYTWIGAMRENGEFVPTDMQAYQNGLFRKYGIKTCAYVNGAPEFLRDKSNPRCLLAEDPRATYRFARQFAAAFRDTVIGVEFFNELDHAALWLYPSWEVATQMKAMALGLKQVVPAMKMTTSAGTMNLGQGRWNWEVAEQGLAGYVDVVNHHTYDPVASYRRSWGPAIARIASNAYGNDRMGAWFTECCTRAEGASRGIVTRNETNRLVHDHDEDQEFFLAEFTAKSQLEMQATGVVQYTCTFLMRPYEERAKSWGLLRRVDFTAKPALAVLASLTEQLGQAKLLGEFDLGNPKVRAYLYAQPDGMQSIAFWTITEVDTMNPGAALKDIRHPRPVKVMLPFVVPRHVGVFGSPEPVAPNGAGCVVTSYRMPGFLHGLRGLKPTKAIETRAFDGAPPMPGHDLTLVLQARTSLPVTFNGDALLIGQGAGRGVTLRLFNFSDQPKRGILTVTGGEVAGLPARVEVPAQGMAEVPVRLECGRMMNLLRLSGDFDGKAVSPLILPVVRRDLAQEGNWLALRKDVLALHAPRRQHPLVVPRYQGTVAGVEFKVTAKAGDGKVGRKLIHFELTDADGKVRRIGWGEFQAIPDKECENFIRIQSNPGERVSKVIFEPFLSGDAECLIQDVRILYGE
jgi:hypothetical protein